MTHTNNTRRHRRSEHSLAALIMMSLMLSASIGFAKPEGAGTFAAAITKYLEGAHGAPLSQSSRGLRERPMRERPSAEGSEGSAAATPPNITASGPETSSPRPTAAEWKTATALAFTRPHPLCDGQVLREWVRVACRPLTSDAYFNVRILGGSHDDVRIADLKRTDKKSRLTGTAIVFPMRRGDRRLLELSRMEIAPCFRWCDSIEEKTTSAISALWLPSADAPTIVVD